MLYYVCRHHGYSPVSWLAVSCALLSLLLIESFYWCCCLVSADLIVVRFARAFGRATPTHIYIYVYHVYTYINIYIYIYIHTLYVSYMLLSYMHPHIYIIYIYIYIHSIRVYYITTLSIQHRRCHGTPRRARPAPPGLPTGQPLARLRARLLRGQHGADD